MGNFTLKLNDDQINRLRETFKADIKPNKNPYISTFIQRDDLTVSVYTSNKVVFQGADAEYYGTSFIETRFKRQAGSDEVGTGDYFGPVVVVASIVEECDEELINKYHINDLSIKWPNDIYYRDSKICGILLEAVTTDKIDCLIVGIGLNVNQKTFDNDLKHPASSVSLILNRDIEIAELKQSIYEQLAFNLQKLKQDEDFYDNIVKYDYLKNKEVYADIDNEVKKIKVVGINRDYSLRIEDGNEFRDLFTGEISFHL